jgi:hypothetical protein
MLISNRIAPPKTTALNFGLAFGEQTKLSAKGDVLGILTYPDGREEVVIDKSNVYTLDGGVLAAILFSNNLGASHSRHINVLAVGSGASGSSASPDIADYRQRKIEVPVYKKTFSSVYYRTPEGQISTVPTNIVDFTTTFEASEANGALTEMGLMASLNTSNLPSDFNQSSDVFPERDTTSDLLSTDILVNYLTFPVINKPNGAVLAITWRLTF